jgi:hypothetical protein
MDSTMKQMDQRQCLRVDIQLRCRVTLPGCEAPLVMHTENIGRNGMLVVWVPEAGAPPPPGFPLTVEVELPANHGFGRKCIHCQAEVVWTASLPGELPRVGLNVIQMKFSSYRNDFTLLEDLELAAAGGWLA